MTTDYSKTLFSKFSTCKEKFKSLNLRTNPRPPVALRWIFEVILEKRSPMHQAPKDCAPLNFTWEGKLEPCPPPDRIARTFALLEDFETWLERVQEGEARHQEEMNKQAGAKLANLYLYSTTHK